MSGKNILFYFGALFSGGLFGAGMMISGMVNPANVIGFLDVYGNWNPSLAFVMGGALMVFMPGYLLLIKPRSTPIAETHFSISKRNDIDKRLLLGSAIFGVGWGLAGICPGPAITVLGSGSLNIILFISSMAMGMLVVDKASRRSTPQTTTAHQSA
ncbi:transporter [Enterovibrio norvegicus]|uniref:YeeE/YedE family protein n=1 Tax=Enterovibrio norvegicus TaxID=188144 RepID=UPI000C85ACEB|nr:YeeE/YedE family protein [Enterovibrio norvegicus]MCC4797718.1 YeeE/YedE family protein [Enterovibrio norvegicus]PMH61021.1 transporter [Enterovibrio norvegicus]PMI32736.1 transporter [Enterovibrio norvegicus]PMI38808.1 transporter [Enterovibrio norvegicus]PMN45573.1 transporter [Enterovibrio norvegicus]